MRNWAPIPTRRELSADGVLNRREHSAYLRLCEVGEDLARHLHGVTPDRRKALAALKRILTSGHDVVEDGSIFECALCWNTAKRYAATGRFDGLAA